MTEPELNEQRLGELTENIVQLTEQLPTWLDTPPAEDLQTFEELENAATDLWTLWRHMQVKRDLATCR